MPRRMPFPGVSLPHAGRVQPPEVVVLDFLKTDILAWIFKDPERRDRRGAAPRGRQKAKPLGPGAKRVKFEGHVLMVQGNQRMRATSGDISEGGAYIKTRQPPGVGSEIMLTILLDENLSLVTTAQVRWIGIDERYRPTGCGVSFEPLSDETRAAVRRVLDAAEARQQPKPAPKPAPRQKLLGIAHGFLDRIAG
jgi:Tfp pilus assembly protein PilZ